MHICIDCGSDLVYPLGWHEEGVDWWVELRCPNCESCTQGLFTQEDVERFDHELDRGADALVAGYRHVVRSNMADDVERLVGALAADALLPEDF